MIDYSLKTQIENFYFNERKTLGQVIEKFNFGSRDKLYRIFKTLDIKLKDKSTAMSDKAYQTDLEFFNKNNIHLDKDILQKELETTSVLQLCKKYNISKSMLSRYINYFGLQNNYYKNLYLHEELLKEENLELTPKQLALKYNVNITTIKKYKKTEFISRVYSIEEIKQKINEYGYDLNLQSIVKKIKQDDKNLYDSIIKHTKNHKLQSVKFTEKLYRILHNFSPEKQINCKYCQEQLKFYTFNQGYGSENSICKNCLPKHCGFGVSKSSQELFFAIYNSLIDKNNVYFNDLNEETKIYLTKDDKLKFNLLNTSYYRVDFTQNKNIIEFDGEYWHKNIDFDSQKDKFFISKGFKILRIKEKEYLKNKQKIIEQCINFLTQ